MENDPLYTRHGFELNTKVHDLRCPYESSTDSIPDVAWEFHDICEWEPILAMGQGLSGTDHWGLMSKYLRASVLCP